MADEKKCPCEAVRMLEKQVEEQRTQLAKADTQFAVILTKLNLIMGILGTVGATLAGIIIKMILV